MKLLSPLLCLMLLLSPAAAGALHEPGEGKSYTVETPPSTMPGRLRVGVTYTCWLPPGDGPLRGVIVHQHGCGEGAENGGATATEDAHWRELARRRRCALFGASYRGRQDCPSWADPDRGSSTAFREALAEFGRMSGHPELKDAGWALWGHSGGAVWAFRMMLRHPDRVLAVWLRSGRPTMFDWDRRNEPGSIPPPSDLLRSIPVMVNVGAREKGDERFGIAYAESRRFASEWRAQGGLTAFVADPRTGHECGNSRFAAIPYFDAALRLRLPITPGGPARAPDQNQAWLGDASSGVIAPASRYALDSSSSSWLPGEAAARAWRSYATDGSVPDNSPPPRPGRPSVRASGRSVTLQWAAEPDWQSGIRAFNIYRDGRLLARLDPPAASVNALPQWQPISYHDTPVRAGMENRWRDEAAPPGRHRYQVETINGENLPSGPGPAVEILLPES